MRLSSVTVGFNSRSSLEVYSSVSDISIWNFCTSFQIVESRWRDKLTSCWAWLLSGSSSRTIRKQRLAAMALPRDKWHLPSRKWPCEWKTCSSDTDSDNTLFIPIHTLFYELCAEYKQRFDKLKFTSLMCASPLNTWCKNWKLICILFSLPSARFVQGTCNSNENEVGWLISELLSSSAQGKRMSLMFFLKQLSC